MTTPRQQRYGLTRDTLVLHCPGPLRARRNPFHREWEQVCETFFADESLRGTCKNHPDLTIITYNTRPEPCLLEECCSHLGLNLVVLGREKNDWRLDYKISLLWTYLQSGSCRSEYVLCLDGYDVLVLSDPELILSRFLERNCEILFTSTAWDHPPQRECWQFEESVSPAQDRPHCHLNSGGYIGRRTYVARKLAEIAEAMQQGSEWCLADSDFDDQLAWRQMHHRYFPAIKVDTSCCVFIRFDHHARQTAAS